MKHFAKYISGFVVMVAVGATAADSEAARFKKIPSEHSKIDVRIDGLDHPRVRHYYIKPKAESEHKFNRYVVYFLNKRTGQYLQANVDVVATDEFFWSYVSDTTVDTIQRLKYFKNKAIKIKGMSSGMNAGYDSVAGEPSYILFTSDDLNCGRMRRISSFGSHGGTEKPHLISGFYCAARGDDFTAEQALRIAKNGLIFRALVDRLGNDLYPPPKL
jgi:hypothetical protein